MGVTLPNRQVALLAMRTGRGEFFDGNPFRESPALRVAQHEKRSLRTVLVSIEGVEPRSKKAMPESDKDEVQRQLLKALQGLRRRAFRGPVALSMLLATTETTPSYSHHIAKNLLDLFSKPRENVATRRTQLLYADDSQVHGLCVICRHGWEETRIDLDARSMGAFLADLDIAREQMLKEYTEDDFASDAVDELRRALRTAPKRWDRFGPEAYDTMLRWTRYHAQEAFLGSVAVKVSDLAYLYGLGKSQFFGDAITREVEAIFSKSPLRIQLGELPQTRGTSRQYRAEIDRGLREFKQRYRWIMDPVIVPIAMEVVVKPPPNSRRQAIHDLDNVVRNYLLPRLFEIIKPLSDHSFTYDVEAVAKDLNLPPIPRPPLSTRIGVTRYEAWRLPPAREGEKGFVSVAIAADTKGPDSTFREVDEAVDRWKEKLRHDDD